MCENYELLLSRLIIGVSSALLISSLAMFSVGVVLVHSPQVLLLFDRLAPVTLDTIIAATGGQFLDGLKQYGVMMVVIGSVLSVTAVFGFCGVAERSSIMFGIYIALLSVVLLADASLTVYSALAGKMFDTFGKDVMLNGLKANFKNDGSVDVSSGALTLPDTVEDLAWWKIHYKYVCCGVAISDDFKEMSWNRLNCTGTPVLPDIGCPDFDKDSIYKVPISCCRVKNSTAEKPIVPTNYDQIGDPARCLKYKEAINPRGCFDAMKDSLEEYIIRAAAICVGLSVSVCCMTITLIVVTGAMFLHITHMTGERQRKRGGSKQQGRRIFHRKSIPEEMRDSDRTEF